jgi:DNA-binding Xre family transcriptional regulator
MNHLILSWIVYFYILTDKAAEQAEKAAKKAVAKANGSKIKAEKEAVMAERMAELDAAGDKAD